MRSSVKAIFQKLVEIVKVDLKEFDFKGRCVGVCLDIKFVT